MAWPPDLADFHTFGLPPAALVPEVRAVKSIDVATSVFVLPSHGLADGDIVQLAVAGTGATLPAPTSAASLYTVKRLSSHAFQLVGVTLTTAGTGIVQVLVDLEPKVLRVLAGCASDVQARAVAYKAPWSVAPPWAVRRACHLAAGDLAPMIRTESPAYSVEKLLARAAAADAFLDKLEAGIPLAEAPADATPNIEEGGATAWADADRGFGAPDGALR